ncbi:hypothetical protein GH714_018569 [Hevea brasiliensis]|uniref:MADS-box domain-containing protein n=1 Tax=Hevea brasiliensis TaxID=3981 RepID=A0A6A6L3Z5_HEVBR|nr:hypothetical protein GH714_018569 [Hevea brasiliensis]
MGCSRRLKELSVLCDAEVAGIVFFITIFPLPLFSGNGVIIKTNPQSVAEVDTLKDDVRLTTMVGMLEDDKSTTTWPELQGAVSPRMSNK